MPHGLVRLVNRQRVAEGGRLVGLGLLSALPTVRRLPDGGTCVYLCRVPSFEMIHIMSTDQNPLWAHQTRTSKRSIDGITLI